MEYHKEVISRKKSIELGLKNYFTGKPCKYGHISERHVETYSCCECRRISALKWKTKNKEKSRECSRRWEQQNPERATQKRKEWREENREYLLKLYRDYYRRNKYKAYEYLKIYRAANRDLVLQWKREYRERNRDKIRSAQARRRSAIKDGATNEEVSEWCQKEEKTCFYCGINCPDSYHIDHYVPLSKGGKHEIHNLRIACSFCNHSKSDKMPEEFLLNC